MLTVARSLAKLPVAPAPAGFRVQPVEADEVAARVFRDGANLAPEQAVGRRTWEEFLADRAS